jgi:hypothetical protein
MVSGLVGHVWAAALGTVIGTLLGSLWALHRLYFELPESGGPLSGSDVIAYPVSFGEYLPWMFGGPEPAAFGWIILEGGNSSARIGMWQVLLVLILANLVAAVITATLIGRRRSGWRPEPVLEGGEGAVR